MLKYIFNGILALSFIFLFSCKKNPSEFTIEGELTNISESSFYLAREYSDSLAFDTISVDKKGRFSFKGYADTLTTIIMYFNNNTRSTFAFVDKGWKVSLKGDVLYPDLIEVNGGEVNDDITKFKKKNFSLLKTRSEILRSTEKDARINYKKKPSSDKDYTSDLKNINFELSNIASGYVKDHPDKIAAVVIMDAFFHDESYLTRLEEGLDLLQEPAVSFPLTLKLRKFHDKVQKTAIGASAPSLNLKDLNGKEIHLNDYKGKYIYLSFFLSGCDICHQDKQKAIDLYNNFRKEKVPIEFISIVINTEEKNLSEEEKKSIAWPIVSESGGWGARILDIYNINKLPYGILISPEGIIIGRDISLFSIESKLEELAVAKTV